MMAPVIMQLEKESENNRRGIQRKVVRVGIVLLSLEEENNESTKLVATSIDLRFRIAVLRPGVCRIPLLLYFLCILICS